MRFPKPVRHSVLFHAGLLATFALTLLAQSVATSNVTTTVLPSTVSISMVAESVDSMSAFTRQLDVEIERLLGYRQLVAETVEETESVDPELAGYLPTGPSGLDAQTDALTSLELLSLDLSDSDSWLFGSSLYESTTERIERGQAILSLPISSPVSGTITSGFGMRDHPILRGRRMHKGLDIAAPTGTEIRAPGGGFVVFSGRKNGYGNTVIVDHGFGYTTLYAHCSKLLVEKGATVSRDDVIALVGSTGRSTGPHLHYEVRVDGQHMNPKAFVLYERDATETLQAVAEWYLMM